MLYHALIVFALLSPDTPSPEVQAFTNIRNLKAQHVDAAVETDLALNYIVLEQRELAKAAIRRALQTDARYIPAHYMAGRLALELEQDPPGAIAHFQQALALDPANFKVNYYIGTAYAEAAKYEAARTYLVKATANAPYGWPFLSLAELELSLNRPHEALPSALKAVAMEPNRAENALTAAKVYQALGNVAEAERLARKAIELDPLWDAPHFLLGKLYTGAARTQELERFRTLKEQESGGDSAAVALRNAPQALSEAELSAFGAVRLTTDPADIIRTGERFLNEYPNSEFEENVLELEFQAFRQRNDYAALRRTGAAILKLDPTNIPVLAELALQIANHSDSADAGAYTDRVIEAGGHLPKPSKMSRSEFADWKAVALGSAHAARGILALRRKDAAPAIAELEEAVRLHPHPGGVLYLRLGEAYVLNKQTVKASDAFARAEELGPPVIGEAARRQRLEQVVRDNPQLAEAWHNLGLVYYQTHEYPRAIDCLQHALDIKPELKGSRLFLGLAQFQLGEYAKSAESLERFIAQEPTNREANLFLIRDQNALGRFDRKVIDRALGIAPQDAEMNYLVSLASLDHIRELAKIGLRGPEYDATTDLLSRAYQAVLAGHPTAREAHSLRGLVHEAKNEIEQALEEYKAAGDPFLAGRLLAQNARLDEAEQAFSEAIALDPRNDRARADLARVYLQNSHSDQAVPLLTELVQRYPTDALAWADLGKAQLQRGDLETGRKCFEKALKLDESLNQVHYQLAMLYRKLGKEDHANDELRQFKKPGQ